ncbi:3-oxoacyl-acp reductase [Fusarium austroafricanum]|uniref:3-oxoacyl-acp reductase n=1 Tax=Fusarium austroafricanum TaxID=2364996 RepID=A0A8H4KQT8_9HYPO|nr:3-oxoacyl-acp reductase [Fusarium austroafricanum]
MGREHALLFAKRGVSVVINDLSEEVLKPTKQMIQDCGGEATAVAGSVSEQEVLDRIVKSAIETYGGVHILVNNAGIEIKKPFEQFTNVDVERMFNVHFQGSYKLTQLVWPYMQKQFYGRIVMVCSTSTYGMPQNAAYAPAKGALLGLAKSLAFEGREYNIQVNAFAPAAFTDMAKQILKENDSAWDHMLKHYPAFATSPGQIVSSWGRSFGKIFIVGDGWTRTSQTEGYFVPNDVIEQNSILEASRAELRESAYGSGLL